MKAGETTVLKLLQGSKVFLIPNFQRRYSWRAKEWELLWNDLRREYDVDHQSEGQEMDGHFLGSIVLHPAGGAASVLMQHLVIDGQQRLTTLIVLLAALRDVRSEMDSSWDPAEYDTKYLTNPYDPDQPNRLLPTELDRDAYVRTVRLGVPTEGIGQAYKFFEKRIREAATDGVNLARLGNTLLLHMLIVEINTGAGDSVNNIFNTLNSKGMPLTAADLVRNELLLHVGEAKGRFVYDKFWKPIERALVKEVGRGFDDREFVTFLWSREVAASPDTTRQDLFSTFERNLRRELDGLPQAERQRQAIELFEEIYRDHLLFRMVRKPLDPEFDTLGIDMVVRLSLDRLRSWGSEPATPVALWIAKSTYSGHISSDDAASAIEILLGYMVRRALAGVPTNLLNRLLTPLASRLQASSGIEVSDRMRRLLAQKGYYWPTDEEVLAAVPGQPIFLSAKRQIRFLLEECERIVSPLEPPEFDGLTVEHVIPQVLSDDWRDYFRQHDVDLDDALALTHTLGNLTLSGYNSQMGNGGFESKILLLGNSALRLNRDIAEMRGFLPHDVQQRSRQLARLLLNEFEGPRGRWSSDESDPSRTSASDRLELALQAMPEGAWTTPDELVTFIGADLATIRRLVSELDAVLARLVREEDGASPTWLPRDLKVQVDAQETAIDSTGLTRSDSLGTLVDAVVQDGDAGVDEGAADQG